MSIFDSITNFVGLSNPSSPAPAPAPKPSMIKKATTPSGGGIFDSLANFFGKKGVPKPKEAYNPTPKKGPDATFNDVADLTYRPVTRGVGTLFYSLAHAIKKSLPMELSPDQATNPKLAKVIFGNEPIKAIGPGGEGSKTKDFLQKKGFGKSAAPIAFGLSVGGEIFNSLNPFGGGKKLAEKLLVEKTEQGIAKHLAEANLAEHFTQSEIKTLAETTDKKVVDDILSNKANTLKERGFAKSVKENPEINPKIKEKIQQPYNPITNKGTIEEATRMIETDELAARRLLDEKPTALSNTVGQLLIKRANEAGNFDDAVHIVEKMAPKATTQGQAIQALSLFGKLTPEGILRYAEKQLSKAGMGEKFTPKFAEKVVKKAEDIAKMPEGTDRTVETAVLMKEISDQIPVSLWKKVSSIQTMMQLLNPKTIVRNLVGNTGFAITEKATQALSTPLDLLTSAFTGKRTVGLPSLRREGKAFTKGFREGVREAIKGVNTTGVTSQFELPRSTFKGGLMSKAEKTLSVVLGGPDRAFYQAAKEGSLYRQMKAAGITKPTLEMEEIAHFDGLYATFQDDNVISRAFIQLKHVLNFQKDFGVGDFLLKYPKTPANLLSRGLAYSPAGFAKAIFELTRPLAGKAFNQKKFVESTARAIVGTGGLIGTGAILHKLGIITGAREQDTDVNTLQKVTGLGAYKINTSALKRFALSGFNPEMAKLQEGDKLISYDWFQPAAIGLSIGANFDQSKGSTKSALSSGIDSLSSGINTLAEQPLVSGLYSTLKNSQQASDIPGNIFVGVPASFVPTLLNQIRTYMDNTQRATEADTRIKQALNMAQNKIPGLEKKLPPKIGPFGETMENYQGGTNNVFNVFFNPAFISKYATTPEAKLVLDIFNASGETKQAPRNLKQSYTPSTVKVNGVNIKLKPNQTKYMQTYIGSTTRDMFKRLAQNQQFLNMNDTDKANYMSTLMTNIGSAAKILILGDRPKKKPNKMVQDLLSSYKSPY